MGRRLQFISFNLLRTDASLFQKMIQKHPGARAALPVGIPASRQIFHTTDSFGIALFYHQPLDPAHTLDQRHLPVRKDPLQIGNVINAGFFIQKMRRRDVGFSPLQRHQSGHAANMRTGKMYARKQIRQKICQKVHDQIVTSHGYDRMADLILRPPQFYLHLFPGLITFQILIDDTYTVRLYQAGSRGRSSGKGRRHQAAVHLSYLYPYIFFMLQRRNKAFGYDCLLQWTRLKTAACKKLYDRLYKSLKINIC